MNKVHVVITTVYLTRTDKYFKFRTSNDLTGSFQKTDDDLGGVVSYLTELLVDGYKLLPTFEFLETHDYTENSNLHVEEHGEEIEVYAGGYFLTSVEKKDISEEAGEIVSEMLPTTT